MKINKNSVSIRPVYVHIGNSTSGHLLDIKDTFSPSHTLEDDEKFLRYTGIKDLERNYLESNKTRYNRMLTGEMLHKGVMGAAVGFILLEQVLGPIGAPLAGAAAGAFMAWDKIAANNKGKVEIDIDGQKFKETYYLDPKSYEQSPELKKLLKEKFDAIDPVKIDADKIKDIDREKLRELKPFADTLVKLEKEKRLVASFGKKSRQGKEALHLIDANIAKNLIASGQTVFIVMGEKITETPHTYTATAKNKEKTVFVQEAHDMLEKQIDYSLTEIKSPEDLTGIKDGKGVPEGMSGVYKDSNSFSQTVYKKYQYGYDERGKEEKKHDYSLAEKSRISGEPDIKTTDIGSKTVYYMNAPFLTAMGTSIVANIAATALGAAPQVGGVALIAGGFAGYHIGKRIIRSDKFSRIFKVGESDNTDRRFF